jgi:hypothetical protein
MELARLVAKRQPRGYVQAAMDLAEVVIAQQREIDELIAALEARALVELSLVAMLKRTDPVYAASPADDDGA